MGHLQALFKAANSLNLFNKNPVLFKVAVNDYRYFKMLYKRKKIKPSWVEPKVVGANIHWKDISKNYDGSTKYGFRLKPRFIWYNQPFNQKKE